VNYENITHNILIDLEVEWIDGPYGADCWTNSELRKLA
jgi:hypothetical protein